MRPQLHIEIEGADPPLVLVNGATCTVRQWDRVVEALAAGWTVIRHDVRGIGRSAPGPAEEYRFEQYADDIIQICAEAGFDRFDLWGMAWGHGSRSSLRPDTPKRSTVLSCPIARSTPPIRKHNETAS